MKTLYQAKVVSIGGRAGGFVKSSDGILDLAILPPAELGGTGEATNPEQLFAAGYAACFEGAIHHVAQNRKDKLAGTSVTCIVTLAERKDGGLQLSVKMEVRLVGIDKEEGNMLMAEAHKVCPYSNATRGNIEVELEFIPQ